MVTRRTFVASASAALTLPAWAQAFPTKVIRIVPFGTGGGPIDTLARAYGEKLTARAPGLPGRL